MKLKKKKAVKAAEIILCVIAAIAIAFLFLKPKPKFDPNARTGIMPGSQIDLQKELDKSKVDFSANTSATVKDGMCNLMFENPKNDNKYLSIQLIADGKQKIYQSGLLKNGSYLTDVPVSASLTKGKHKANIIIQSYDISTMKPIGKVGAQINLYVE